MLSGRVVTDPPLERYSRGSIETGVPVLSGRVVTETPVPIDGGLQEILIGAPDLMSGSIGFVQWDNIDALISSGLIVDEAAAYLIFFRIYVNGSNVLRTATTTTEDEDLAGPDLTEVCENYTEAFTVKAGNVEIIIPGPNADGTTQDSSEPYFWGDDVVTVGQIQEYLALSPEVLATTVFVIDNGENPAAYARGSITTGVPELSARVVALPAADVRSSRGSITTGAPELSARVITFPPPPELYCLDADNSDTTEILDRKDKVIKIFVEMADELDALLTSLPDGKSARPLLLDTPELRIDDSFFQGAGDISLRLDNRDGEFDDDQVGRYVQVWSLSFGSEKRSVFLGRVDSQTSSQLECTFTVSDLPVESLKREIPTRTVTQADFPNSRVSGVPVPVVFGRAIRLRCPHLDSGIVTDLYEPAEAGDTEVFISTTRGIAVGDKLFISPGELEVETGIVESVDGDEPSITFVEGLENDHPVEAVVAAADVVEDYLLGEGVWEGGNFSKVFRVYHEERALPELTCPDRRPSANLDSGEQDFTLDEQHHVQFADWYRNYFIEFLDEVGQILGGSLISSYDSEDNVVAIDLPARVRNYTCYRLRQYRFFDGSQTTPMVGMPLSD